MVGILGLSATLIEKSHESVRLPELMAECVEALSDSPENYVKVHERQTPKCEIDVGAKGKIQLLGGTILTADASGKISFDGQVVCIGTGDTYCKPIECVDLYKTFF